MFYRSNLSTSIAGNLELLQAQISRSETSDKGVLMGNSN